MHRHREIDNARLCVENFTIGVLLIVIFVLILKYLCSPSALFHYYQKNLSYLFILAVNEVVDKINY